MGLVNRIVPADELFDGAVDLARFLDQAGYDQMFFADVTGLPVVVKGTGVRARVAQESAPAERRHGEPRVLVQRERDRRRNSS